MAAQLQGTPQLQGIPAQSPTLAYIAEKWQRKTLRAIEKWRAAVTAPDIRDRYAAGIRVVAGVDPSPDVVQDYYVGVTSEGAYTKYRNKVSSPQAKEKWVRNWIAGLTARKV